MYPDPTHVYYTTFGEWWEAYSEGGKRHPIGGSEWLAAKAAWDYGIISVMSLIQREMR